MVICPPIGQEHLITYWGLRRLAEQLVTLDFLVCRFDYSGTGDSAGGPSATPVADWTADVGAAVDLVAALGVEHVALVGMRIGASLAAELAAQDDRIGPLVMWDPVAGRAFLREQQAAFSMVFGPWEDRNDLDVIETLGFAYDRAAAADLGRLRRVLPTPSDRPALLLVRPQSGALDDPPEATDVIELEGQAEFVDLDALSVPTPVGTVDRISGWLDDHLPQERRPLLDAALAEMLVLEGGPGGDGPVRERIDHFGPSKLLAVVAEPVTRIADRTVVFLGVATEPRFGPGRMWTELSRSLAASGARAIRFDFRGVGDSPGSTGQDPGLYRPEDIEDVIDVCRDLGSDGSPIALVGLCSGGYGAVEAALASRVETLCLINPVLAFTPPEIQLGRYDPLRAPDHRLSAVDPRRSAAYPTGTVIRFMQGHETTRRMLRSLPSSIWNALDRIGVQRSAVRGLEWLAERGTSAMLFVTEAELMQFTTVGPHRLRRLQANGTLQIRRSPREDHSLYSSMARSAVAHLVEDHVRDMAPPPRGPVQHVEPRIDQLQGAESVHPLH